MRNEIKALKAIKDKETIDKFRYPYDYIPEVIDHGDFLFHNGQQGPPKLSSYYIMKRYGTNLDELFC